MQREQCESNIYHVTCRGIGRQIIFEDDDDRKCYIGLFGQAVKAVDVEVLAWCLMDNHVHLLLRAPIEDISQVMQRVNGTYARVFNERHDRVGHLFQGRFTSVPVKTDEQLLVTVRYIHLNPQDMPGVDFKTYTWSSYREYLHGPGICNASFVLELANGLNGFKDLHETIAGSENLRFIDGGRCIPDSQVLDAAHAVLGSIRLSEVKAMPRDQRNECIRSLRQAGLSIRQVERVTSIGRSIIARAM